VDYFVATINGAGWTATNVHGVWLAGGPVLTVSGTNPSDANVHRLSLYVQNRTPPGSYSITGYTAGITVTTGSDSTITIADTHDPGLCPNDDPCPLVSMGTITIDGIWGGRITGRFSFAMGAINGSGSFSAAFP